MMQVKTVSSDIRSVASGAMMDAAAAQPVNVALIELVRAGCTILGPPKLIHVDTGRYVFNIAYDDPSLD